MKKRGSEDRSQRRGSSSVGMAVMVSAVAACTRGRAGAGASPRRLGAAAEADAVVDTVEQAAGLGGSQGAVDSAVDGGGKIAGARARARARARAEERLAGLAVGQAAALLCGRWGVARVAGVGAEAVSVSVSVSVLVTAAAGDGGLLAEAELGLDGGAVDAVAVETLADAPGQLHVLFAAELGDGKGHLDVHGGDDLRVRQLPDVDVVAAEHAGEALDVLADVVDVDVVGRGLQQDLGRRLSQRDGRPQDDGRDQQRHHRVRVHAVRPRRLPDDQRRHDHANVAQRVAHDVQHHGVHAHVVVAVAVAVSARLARVLGQAVVVVAVRVPSLPLVCVCVRVRLCMCMCVCVCMCITAVLVSIRMVVVVSVGPVGAVLVRAVRSSVKLRLSEQGRPLGGGAGGCGGRVLGRRVLAGRVRVRLVLDVAGGPRRDHLLEVLAEDGRVDADVVNGRRPAPAAVGTSARRRGSSGMCRPAAGRSGCRAPARKRREGDVAQRVGVLRPLVQAAAVVKGAVRLGRLDRQLLIAILVGAVVRDVHAVRDGRVCVCMAVVVEAVVVVVVVDVLVAVDVLMVMAGLLIISTAVRVAVATENPEADQVRNKAENADDQDNLRVADVGRLEESLDRLQHNGDAETDQKGGVEKGTEDFGTQPLQNSKMHRSDARSNIDG